LSQDAEEHFIPWIPTQHAVEQTSACADELTGHDHEVVDKGFELHAQHRVLVLLVTLGSTAVFS
jgi:hypothetical protein